MRDHGEADEGGNGPGVALKSRAKRRKRLSQAKVRSTIQLLGKTSNPTAAGERPTISMIQVALATRDLLARIEARRVARPPFLRTLGALAVDDCCGGTPVTPVVANHNRFIRPNNFLDRLSMSIRPKLN
jgi:hypothetical protein